MFFLLVLLKQQNRFLTALLSKELLTYIFQKCKFKISNFSFFSFNYIASIILTHHPLSQSGTIYQLIFSMSLPIFLYSPSLCCHHKNENKTLKWLDYRNETHGQFYFSNTRERITTILVPLSHFYVNLLRLQSEHTQNETYEIWPYQSILHKLCCDNNFSKISQSAKTAEVFFLIYFAFSSWVSCGSAAWIFRSRPRLMEPPLPRRFLILWKRGPSSRPFNDS